MSSLTEIVELPTAEATARIGEDEAWAAVLTRDPTYDGRFFFGVSTTGVYCRPGCSARSPRRENVRIFQARAEAEAAGFRACMRCRPDDRRSAAQGSVERAREYLDAHLDENVTLERLAGIAFMSAYHLQRTFKRQLGLTPRQYVEARRAERLKARLRDGETVSRATFEAGYGSASRAYEQVDAHMGMTPGAYRKGGRGMTIRFATAASALGRVLVAATERGLCAVTLGDDDERLAEALRREYPQARIEPAGEELREWVERIVGYVEGTITDLSLPLDFQATTFQWRVWRALQQVPYGSTASYQDVARAIGQPTAARAVARACASNRVALVIPCHRAVRGDGEVSGYRWGAERKRRLLAMEAAGAAEA